MENRCQIIELKSSGDEHRHQFAREILAGLRLKPKQLLSTYHYDQEGSRLFQKITELDEYYLTSCEREIFRNHHHEIAALLCDDVLHIIELGVGDGHKSMILLEHFLSRRQKFRYIPIDISREAFRQLNARYQDHCPEILDSTTLLQMNYQTALDKLPEKEGGHRVVLFLGSSIGNLTDMEALQFLFELRMVLSHGDWILIGFDLIKDIAVMERAYNDHAQTTAAFNLNLLTRINREFDANFSAQHFQFRSYFDFQTHAIESWLVSLRDQQVEIPGLGFSLRLETNEGIHVETSRKYQPQEILQLARQSGFKVKAEFYDSRRYFLDTLWQIDK